MASLWYLQVNLLWCYTLGRFICLVILIQGGGRRGRRVNLKVNLMHTFENGIKYILLYPLLLLVTIIQCTQFIPPYSDIIDLIHISHEKIMSHLNPLNPRYFLLVMARSINWDNVFQSPNVPFNMKMESKIYSIVYFAVGSHNSTVDWKTRPWLRYTPFWGKWSGFGLVFLSKGLVFHNSLTN